MNYLYATVIVIGAILGFLGIVLYCAWAYFEAEENDNTWPMAIPAALVILVMIGATIWGVAQRLES